MSPLILFPDVTAAMPMRYCGEVNYYAVMAAHGSSVIDCSTRYNKREKETHRMDICDTHGLLSLTVPVSLPSPIAEGKRLGWEDINVSAHGGWWNVHLTALESAYGRTPFFQFYIDRFLPMFTNRYEKEDVALWEFNKAFTDEICDILGIERPQYRIDSSQPLESVSEGSGRLNDYRSIRRFNDAAPVEYYQIRRDHFGFMPGLSVLDLIFNMGPESPLVLKEQIDRTFREEIPRL